MANDRAATPDEARGVGRREADVRDHVKAEMFSVPNLMKLGAIISGIATLIYTLLIWMGVVIIGPGERVKMQIDSVSQRVDTVVAQVDSIRTTIEARATQTDTIVTLLRGLSFFVCTDPGRSARELLLSGLPCAEVTRAR